MRSSHGTQGKCNTISDSVNLVRGRYWVGRLQFGALLTCFCVSDTVRHNDVRDDEGTQKRRHRVG